MPSAVKAEATTTVGSTKGTASTTERALRPGNSTRANTYAAGIPTARLSAVEASAWRVLDASRPARPIPRAVSASRAQPPDARGPSPSTNTRASG